MNNTRKPTPDEIKTEVQHRHDAGAKTGEDDLYLDVLELIVDLQIEVRKLKKALQKISEIEDVRATMDSGYSFRIDTIAKQALALKEK